MPLSNDATVVAIGPIVSKNDGARAAPVQRHATPGGLEAHHTAAGRGDRIDPPVSLPKAMSASADPTATAEPLDDPPRARLEFSGFRGLRTTG